MFALFAFFNLERVEVYPFPNPIPLFVVLMAAFVLGLLFGAFFAWLGGHAVRARSRERKRRIDALEKALADAQARTEASHRPAAKATEDRSERSEIKQLPAA